MIVWWMKTPTEADDSLQSVQFGSVLDLLSEGEIEGIEGGVREFTSTTRQFKAAAALTILLATPLSLAMVRRPNLIFRIQVASNQKKVSM
jgi:hypothetical protein